MLRLSLCLREKVRQLELRGHIVKSENLILHSGTHKESIHTDVLGELMLHRVTRNAHSTRTV
jgi:hypothetical protein